MKSKIITNKDKIETLLLDFQDRWELFLEMGAGGLGLYLSRENIDLESDPEANDFITNFIEKRKTEDGLKSMKDFLKKRLNK